MDPHQLPQHDSLPSESQLPHDGERMVPDLDREGLIYVEHVVRYRFAAQLVEGKRVLDVACGAGYGCATLSNAGAAEVVGVDRAAAAVEYAHRRYGGMGRRFLACNATQMPFAAGSFDVVISFETLEHLGEQARFVDEVRRVLGDDGLFVLSTPNRLRYPKGNPFHVHELDDVEFEAFLRGRFRHVELLAQDNWTAGAILRPSTKVDDGDGPRPRVTVDGGVSEEPLGPLYLLAICSDGPLPEPLERVMLARIPPQELLMYLARDDELRAVRSQRDEWESQARALERDRDRWATEAAALGEDRDGWAAEAAAVRENRDGLAGDVAWLKAELLGANIRLESAERLAQRRQVALAALESEAVGLHGDIRLLGEELAALRGARTFALAARIGRAAGSLLPPGSSQRRMLAAARATVRELAETGRRLRNGWRTPSEQAPPPIDQQRGYSEWRQLYDATPDELRAQRETALRASNVVAFICLIGGAEATPEGQATLASLRAQTWPFWSFVFAWEFPGGPGAVDPEKVRQSVEDSGQDFVLFLRAGDRLTPDCLYHVSAAASRDPLLELVTWDDDVLGAGGFSDPRFRPDWSPELLLSRDYIGRSFALRVRRFLSDGGLRGEYDSHCLWELLLRAQLGGERVARVARILSHLVERREETDADGTRAVGDALSRAGERARAVVERGAVRVTWEHDEWPHVTVIVPTRHTVGLLERCLSSLEKTDYPSFDVVVVDNGDRTREAEAWYQGRFPRLDLSVDWWDLPFNFSAVNNHAAAKARGDILLFLNDDTEVLDPGWMRELAGWARRPGMGLVGCQLLFPDGTIQFAGTIVGLGGFADHVFQGLLPGSDTLLGPTTSYRNTLSVTAACLAVRRSLFESLGGFDEQFILCGGDVALGLQAVLAGLRNVVTPFTVLRHHESATRGTAIPRGDFFASFWAYQYWLFAGDPYFSPSLSLSSRIPQLRFRDEPPVADRVGEVLGRDLRVFRQTSDAGETLALADACRASRADVEAVHRLHEAHRGPLDVQVVNWFIPEFDSPFYGGINTALRIADHLSRHHGVSNRFVVWGHPPDDFIRSGIAAAFPSLARGEICFTDVSERSLERVPEADVSIATLWVTAYSVAKFPHTRRKFYLIQDFEPMFYPASTLYALAEETYRLGLYGLCNTETLRTIYERDYGGKGHAFVPAVDTDIFHAEGRDQSRPGDPVTVFVYARPGHWRNCWELASLALRELKARLGDRVRIVTAGSWALSEDDAGRAGIRHLGLVHYRATGPLYRTCDVGLVLTVSKHPSYLPLELMACGVPVVAFDNPAGGWILRHERNCLLAERTVDGLAAALERLCRDHELRVRLARQAVTDVGAAHGSWEKSLASVVRILADPEGFQGSP